MLHFIVYISVCGVRVPCRSHRTATLNTSSVLACLTPRGSLCSPPVLSSASACTSVFQPSQLHRLPAVVLIAASLPTTGYSSLSIRASPFRSSAFASCYPPTRYEHSQRTAQQDETLVPELHRKPLPSATATHSLDRPWAKRVSDRASQCASHSLTPRQRCHNGTLDPRP